MTHAVNNFKQNVPIRQHLTEGNIYLYADDAKLFRKILNSKLLQRAVNNLKDWSDSGLGPKTGPGIRQLGQPTQII